MKPPLITCSKTGSNKRNLFEHFSALTNLVNSKLWWAIIIAVGVASYWIGDWRGYSRSQAEVKKVQEIAAQKAAEDASNVANPFKAANPLEGVESNPFEKAKKVLNPFD